MRGKLKKIAKMFVLLLVVAAAVSCEKDEGLMWADQNKVEYVVSENGENILKVTSSIDMPQEWPFDMEKDSLKMHLQSLTDRNRETSFWFSYKVEDGKILYRMYIPADKLPANGDYKLKQVLDGKGIKSLRRMRVSMVGNTISQVEPSTASYKGLRGSGTAEEPYMINSVQSLVSFAGSLKQDSLYHGFGLYFKLGCDIDMTDYYSDPFRVMDQGWCGIGGGFAGNFDGGGFTISNMVHSDSGNSDVGLFKELLDEAVVSNLKLDQVNISAAWNNVGAVAGTTSGNVKLKGITVSGNIEAMGEYAGGLVGKAGNGTLKIEDCILKSGQVIANRFAGGLVGCIEGTVKISGSSNNVFQTTSRSSAAGGFIGIVLEGSMENSILNSESSASVYGNTTAGGVIGLSIGEMSIESMTVQASKVNSNSGSIGGFVGSNRGTLLISGSTVFHSSSDNYHENIIGVYNNSSYVGGFVGISEGWTQIKDSEVNVPVSGYDCIGGFVGYNKSKLEIERCTNKSSSRVAGIDYVGGFVGRSTEEANVTITESFQYCNLKCGGDYIGGVAGYAEELHLDRVTVNSSVWGDNYVGGIVGQGTGISMKGVDLSSSNVDGYQYVGGVAGRLEKSYFGSNTFASSFSGKVCSAEEFKTSSKYVGGFAGYVDKCGFKGITVSCSVYGKEFVGGFAGNDYGSGYDGCTFKGVEVKATSNVGGIMGRYNSGDSTVTNLTNHGKIVGTACTAGITGEIMNIGMSNCTNNGRVEGGQDTGGIVGRIDNNDGSGDITFSYCTNNGYVTANKRCLGGIAGYVESGKDDSETVIFSHCKNTASVRGIGSGSGDRDGMGGIVGEGMYSIVIKYCSNTGEIKGDTGFHHIGGLAGYLGRNSYGFDNYIKIYQSYNKGWVGVTGVSGSVYVGGIAGHLEDGDGSSKNVQIEDCFNHGRIYAKCEDEHPYRAGGIVGKASYYLSVYNCYTGKGRVSSMYTDANYRSAGIAGCHATGETLFYSSYIGNLYTEEGTAWTDWWSDSNVAYLETWSSFFQYDKRSEKSSYPDYDFDSIWDVDPGKNDGYPYLRNNP